MIVEITAQKKEEFSHGNVEFYRLFRALHFVLYY